MNYIALLVIFFILGLMEDFCWAMWTKTVTDLKYHALFWSGMLSLFRLVFIMGLVEYKDWTLGLIYCAGLVAGTGVMLYTQKKNKKQISPTN